MAAMKFLALRNPNERWLMALILLFMPSTVPFESRILIQASTPSRWERSILAKFLNASVRRQLEFPAVLPHQAMLPN